jgi:hypothetical protein
MDKDGKLNGRLVVAEDFGKGDEAPTLETNLTVAPQIAAKIESAQDALSNVLANAGCSLHRDAVDARLIDEVKSFGTRGKISHSENEAGGTGELPEIHAPANLKALDAISL